MSESSHNSTVQQRNVAALLTCFNRRATTLRCLEALFVQELPEGVSLRVVLTDDGSSDGTSDAVRERFPQVQVVPGDGCLYWVGGMLAAWRAAGEADAYLWVNDDVELCDGALAALLRTHDEQDDPAAIIVGATFDPATGRTNTGGLWRKSWFRGGVHAPQDAPILCDCLDGNLVLVPRAAVAHIGMMSDAYTHYFGDADYGLRARKAGIPILLAPSYLGACRPNPHRGSVFDHEISFAQRWRRMTEIKGHRPPRQWWAFVRAHAPRPKVIYWLVPYVLFLVEHLLGGRVRIRRNVARPATQRLKAN
jgi:GT2 family glycosyltransferase